MTESRPPTVPSRDSIVRQVRLAGIIPAGLLMMLAGFIGLFFDNATQHEVNTYWIGILIACMAVGVTMLNAKVGLILTLALLVPCAMLADSFHGSPVRIFGLPAFPLTCIALILLAVNLVVIVLDRN